MAVLPDHPDGSTPALPFPPEREEVSVLLARYAPLGRRHRRRQRWRQALLLGAAGIAATFIGPQFLAEPRPPAVIATAPTPGELLRRQEKARLEGIARELATRERQLAARERALAELEAALASRGDALERQGREIQAGLARLASLEERFAAIAEERAALAAEREALKALIEQYEALAATAPPPAGSADEAGLPEPATPLAEPAAGDTIGDGGGSAVPEPGPDGAEPLLLAGQPTVADGELREMRGGLRLGNDMEISFGVTRSASINGVEQFATSVAVGDLAAATGSGAPLQSILIQNGTGNVVTPEALNALAGGTGTLIQNTLDTQHIEMKTVLDISVGNVGEVLGGLGGGNALNESLSLQRP